MTFKPLIATRSLYKEPVTVSVPEPSLLVVEKVMEKGRFWFWDAAPGL